MAFQEVAWFFGVMAAAYGLLSAAFWWGLRRREAGLSEAQPRVSVVIAARNEEGTLPACLASVMAQNYPADRMEVVVVDDRSEDGTARVVEAAARSARCDVRLVRVTSVPAGASAKKHALESGFARATGEVLLITDADCLAEPRWITEMVRRFAPGVGLVAGYAPFGDRTSLWRRILALEVLSQAFIAMGSFGLGRGVTCVARNLAYRREAFEAVGGFSGSRHLASGDDTLLLQQISRRFRVAYCTAPGSAVWSAPTAGWEGFSQQRRRHLSTTLHYTPAVLAAAAFVYAFHLSLFVGVPVAFVAGGGWMAAWAALAFKLGVDGLSMLAAAGVLRERSLLPAFVPAALLYVPYLVVFGALGALGGFTWKDQRTVRAVVPTGAAEG